MKRSRLGIIVVVAIAALALGASAAIAATHSSTRTGTVGVGSTPLGQILVDSRGRSVYLFEKDGRGQSACSGTCAIYWPPLLTKTKPIASGGAKQSLLGVSRRPDGTHQVTYAGHPLYRFVQDTKPGQTRGQDLHDFGAGWYVVAPAGTKIENNGA